MPKGQFIPFTENQIQFIKNSYLNIPIKNIGLQTGATYGRVMRFLNNNNLIIPAAIIEQRKMDSRKKKGDIPFNKGKKQIQYMSAAAIEKTKATRFQKGNEPHNTKKEGNGTIASRKDKTGRIYKHIRIKKGVWELYHRWLWERENGKIPEGYLIVFKDENTLNTTIENLEIITMAENMYRNSKHNYPQEVIPSLVLSKQIETKLKTLQNG